MLYGIAIVIIFIVFLAEEIFLLGKFRRQKNKEKEELLKKCTNQKSEEDSLREKVENLKGKMAEYFFFYELIRKIAHLVDEKEVFNIFSGEIKYLGEVESVEFGKVLHNEGCLNFKLGKDNSEMLSIKTKSKKVIEHLPHLSKLLSLCVERKNLYTQLQQLSIHDSLTKAYNRRHFMIRFLEEFERAKKFHLNLSFLMIDMDHFKKINDTYGHLVGDVVLREAVRMIWKSVREIDFVARFGGEEFSIILPETDKAGAIMVAERISAEICQEKIRAFDEVVTTTTSIGVASFPQNTLHSDVLVEIADKALYKAKISGRNRVCWF
ncbi:MAG: GGDEF domain-containing protein [Candidatus Omnitrophica bacterium]|nr:GGDEF domain-containing protein [Candidatus Omnitrophota bacterium]MBU1133977.1 GGDEF domain-containing protein [Candidatus Omnitrophota bacterium]MBU1367156.1 GGDEF domain-containing protein [Candidatus Omnitrophota bacterium]MBU1523773.1 GGDEF domain-containing protein [Candidatus Omnitrophota bacterium]MBU1809965.1 GGDEF domain-containing protein [Candidatus Omnitrophota bacterium]